MLIKLKNKQIEKNIQINVWIIFLLLHIIVVIFSVWNNECSNRRTHSSF